jgi:branched-chain amino acid transport system substrate-binding protein
MFKLNMHFTAAALAVSLACGVQAADPIRIGVSGPFTGGSSPMGVAMRDGIRLAVQEINAAGGVIGSQVQLIERDDEAKNERGAQVVQELINKEKVVAALGIANTGVALASQRFYQEAKIPMITAVATGTQVTRQFLPPQYPDSYIFRVAANDSIQAALIVEEAVERRKFKKVAILADSTNYGQLGREDLETALKRKGVTAVAVEKFNVKDVDMTPQLLKAKSAGAEAVLTYAIGPELAQIANGMAKLGWKVPMVGSWTLSMSNFIDNAGRNGEGARMPQTFIQEATTPKRKAFIEAYQKTYKVERIPSPASAAQGYDAMQLLAAAIKQAGSADSVKIREALENLKEPVAGVVQTYEKPYSKQVHEAVHDIGVLVTGEVKSGQVVYAYDAEKNKVAR